MKKQSLKSLKLNKKSISKLGTSSLNGGTDLSITCFGDCPLTRQIRCNSDLCPTNTCPPPDTINCITNDCIRKTEQPLGVCLY